jgi:hypothetical protein
MMKTMTIEDYVEYMGSAGNATVESLYNTFEVYQISADGLVLTGKPIKGRGPIQYEKIKVIRGGIAAVWRIMGNR